MKFKIITDSCCDLTAAQAAELEVRIAPLSVELEGRAYADGEMTPVELYDHLRNGKLPKTAAVNPEGWAEVIRPVLEEGWDVLVLAFSSGLSATYQSAVIAADELREAFPERRITVIDTLCAAIGQGLLVWHCARLRSEGRSMEEVTAWVEEHKVRLCHWITVEDLMHLKRGGRVSAATAVVGTMLNIKPILRVDDGGKLETTAKCRGRRAAMNHLLERMAESYDPQLCDTVCIGHGDCAEDAAYLEQELKHRFGVKQVIVNYVGAVIGTHTGPGVVFIGFFGKNR